MKIIFLLGESSCQRTYARTAPFFHTTSSNSYIRGWSLDILHLQMRQKVIIFDSLYGHIIFQKFTFFDFSCVVVGLKHRMTMKQIVNSFYDIATLIKSQKNCFKIFSTSFLERKSCREIVSKSFFEPLKRGSRLNFQKFTFFDLSCVVVGLKHRMTMQ